MSDLILAIDQGTTGSTVLIVTPDGTVRGRGYREHAQHFPRPGWVEHDAEGIWDSVVAAATDALADAGIDGRDIAAIGITNQRETLVAWDARSQQAVGPVICWQDRRTADACDTLQADGTAARIRALTGLPTDPYFSATKAQWLLHNDPAVRGAAADGSLRLGTIDSWLVWKLTRGRQHVTDISNAARTLLFDIHRGMWSDELCNLFEVDPAWLPEVVPCSGECGHTRGDALCGIDAPICGMAGDQQAALFGQACIQEGAAKATFGTGAFVLVNAADNAPTSDALISTVGWRIGEQTTYALEGSIFTAGACVQWLRDGLGVITRAADIEPLAAHVPDSGGVMFVPALAGLGAPFWDANARATLVGMTRGTTDAHIARAVLDAVALRVRNVVVAMRDEGTPVDELRVDGGMAANDTFLQLQADILGIPVTRPTCLETTSLGAAFLAGLGTGLLSSVDDVARAWHADRCFEPAQNRAWVDGLVARFDAAVEASRTYAEVVGATTESADRAAVR